MKDDKELEAFKEALIEVDEADDSFNVIFIDASVNSKAARYFGLSESDYPSLVMHDHANGKKFIHKEATPADVKTFVAQWKVHLASLWHTLTCLRLVNWKRR